MIEKPNILLYRFAYLFHCKFYSYSLSILLFDVFAEIGLVMLSVKTISVKVICSSAIKIIYRFTLLLHYNKNLWQNCVFGYQTLCRSTVCYFSKSITSANIPLLLPSKTKYTSCTLWKTRCLHDTITQAISKYTIQVVTYQNDILDTTCKI